MGRMEEGGGGFKTRFGENKYKEYSPTKVCKLTANLVKNWDLFSVLNKIFNVCIVVMPI